MELTELLNNRMETLDQLQLKHKELKEKYEEDILLKNDEKSNILEQKEAELERYSGNGRNSSTLQFVIYYFTIILFDVLFDIDTHPSSPNFSISFSTYNLIYFIT